MSKLAQRTAEFEAHRPTFLGIAYRMLGSLADAEDVVQDAWLRIEVAGAADVRDLRAYGSTIVVRLCLDRLDSARARRETYVGPWLPEPLGGTVELEPSDPHSVSLAFLVLLEALSPLERAAFLLFEVFDWSHAEIARVLRRDEPAVRQLVARARAHVEAGRPRYAASAEAHRAMLEGFALTLASGDTEALARLLYDEAEARSDGGGKVRAARKIVVGAQRVAQLLTGILRKSPIEGEVELSLVAGAPGLVWRKGAEVAGALQIETEGSRIYKVFLVLAPEKLRAFSPPRG